MANKIGIAVQVDDGGAVKKINGISKAFDKLGGPGSGASLFGNVGAKAVAVGFNLIGDAASAATGFLEGAVRAAIEDEASQKRLAVTLQNNIPAWDGNTDAINAYIDAQANLGFSDDEVRDSIGQLIGVTHDLTKAQELNTLAQDLARAKGIDLAQATDIVTKASQGNSKALKALGIDVTGVTNAATALDAIQKNVNGSAAAWAQTTEGKLQTSQVKFNEAVEKLGYVLLPVLTAAMEQLTAEWLPALGRGWDKVYGVISKVIGVIADLIGSFSRVNKQIGDFLSNIGKVNGINITPPIPGLPLPHFAEGGWVGLRGPELAVVGEKGPEYVVPNHRLNSRWGGGFGGDHSHPIFMDGKKVADAVSQRQFYDQRRAGRSAKV